MRSRASSASRTAGGGRPEPLQGVQRREPDRGVVALQGAEERSRRAGPARLAEGLGGRRPNVAVGVPEEHRQRSLGAPVADLAQDLRRGAAGLRSPAAQARQQGRHRRRPQARQRRRRPGAGARARAADEGVR